MNLLTTIVHAAGRKLQNLQMADEVNGDPRMLDALALVDDLRIIWEIIDPVIEAIGQQARSNFGISASDVKDYFTDQLRRQLEGNATFCIQDAVDTIIQSRADDEADYRYKLRREAV